MREVVLLSTREYPNVKCLLTNKIVFLPILCDLEGINALIFTSHYAVRSLLESEKSYPHLAKWREIPSFVIGEESAKMLKNESAHIAFIGQGRAGEAFARDIVPLLMNKTPLYLRPREIVSKLDEILKTAKIPLKEYIAYENLPQKIALKDKPKARSVLIFGAPSAYHSFIAQFAWEESYIAIALGESTLKAFHPDIKAMLSPKPNFEVAIEFAKEIAKTR